MKQFLSLIERVIEKFHSFFFLNKIFQRKFLCTKIQRQPQNLHMRAGGALEVCTQKCSQGALVGAQGRVGVINLSIA